MNAKWYDKTWLVIILCIVFFPVGLYALWKNASIGKGWKFVVTFIILIIVIASFGSQESSNSNKSESASDNSAKKQEVKQNWNYSEDVDKMTTKKTFYAECKSTTEIEFQFPYNGGSNFTLTVRNTGGKNEAMLNVSKGQFVSGLGSTEDVKIKFDNEQPISVTSTMPNDGSADMIFLGSANKIITKLKTSKKVMVEATFYNEGNKLLEFDVSGFNWEH